MDISDGLLYTMQLFLIIYFAVVYGDCDLNNNN